MIETRNSEAVAHAGSAFGMVDGVPSTTPETCATEATRPPHLPARNLAVDAYRGFVMVLMLAEVMRLSEVALHYPGSAVWHLLGYNQSHVEWVGMSLHDSIQPSFTFLVGVALPYSLRSRQQRGISFRSTILRSFWRGLVLVAIGIFLRSLHTPLTNFTFEDTLTQIGLGYPFAVLLAHASRRWGWVAFGMILFGYWLAWALYPLPPAHFDFRTVGLTPEWQHAHLLHGFAAHWNKNVNLGQSFDRWFLNLFPRGKPFLYNEGGYLTLSFIPTLCTMLLGVFTGRLLLQHPGHIPFRRFLQAAASLIAIALLLNAFGINPIVKRIWTPAWTLFSGGVCLLLLCAFSWLIDVRGHRRFAFPFVVVGMNSIAAYVMAHLWEDFLLRSLDTHLRTIALDHVATSLVPLVNGVTVVAIYFAVLLWMYRRRIFLKI